MPTRSPPSVPQFVEDIGAFFDSHGLPRIAGRLLGHLLIAIPEDQTFDQLCEAVAASRGSVSTMTRLLIQLGLIDRTRPARASTDVYRIRDDAWEQLLKDDLRTAMTLRSLAKTGLKILEGERASTQARVRKMHAFYGFLEDEYPRLISKWQSKEAKK